MKPILILISFFLTGKVMLAQNDIVDTPLFGNVTIKKDPRFDLLGKKLAEYNEAVAAKKARAAKGYRLMLLTTNDRSKAMSVRSSLIQQFPDHKVYMIFQSPFIKLKLGNFVEKKEAEEVRKQILASGIITGNIYLIPETVEVRPEPKLEDEE
jgi:hypothetical protein